MPLSARKLDKLVNRVAGRALQAQEACFEQRYQDLQCSYDKAQRGFNQAQRIFQATQQAYEAVQRECQILHCVVLAKMEVIEELLPYYPYALTPELKRKIDLY